MLRTSEATVEVINLEEELSHLHDDDWYWMSDSRNVDVLSYGKHVAFHPYFAMGTHACRGSKPLTGSTISYWRITLLQDLYGTSLMFGVGNAKAETTYRSVFTDLLGKDEHSYGLSHLGVAYHAGIEIRACTPLRNRCSIGILFDGPRRQISFFENDKFICTPFTEIDVSEPLYPMISSTAQQSTFLVDRQKSYIEVPTLEALAMEKIKKFSIHKFPPIWDLPLPQHLKKGLEELCYPRPATVQCPFI